MSLGFGGEWYQLERQVQALPLFQEDVDAGRIILQEAVPVKRGDTVATLSERVKVAEHRVFPAALQLVASGAVRLGEDGRLCWAQE